MRKIRPRSTSTRLRSRATASNASLLSRLCGVEVEYAFRYAPQTPRNLQSLYRAIVRHTLKRVPAVLATDNPNKCFLANGGCISLEANSQSLTDLSGFIETATPQCRSPREVVAYLAAFDTLIEEALTSAAAEGDPLPMAAIRNSCDAFGHRYGQQENYEVTIAEGGWLVLWRTLLCLFFPLLVLHRAAVRCVLLLTLGLAGRGADGDEGAEDDAASAASISPTRLRLATTALQSCHAPLEFCFGLICRVCVMRDHRVAMQSFLASRVALDGAGHVDRNGRFWISSRGRQINAFLGLAGSGRRYPMIDLSHWFRNVCLDNSWSFAALRKLFRRRQRVQICCGDTSTNQWVRWLQLGTTILVLDAAEAGRLKDCPRFAEPHKLLRRFSGDTQLSCEAADLQGRRWSAIGLQGYFISQVRRYLASHKRVPNEAWEILNRWQMMVSRLAMRNSDRGEADALLGLSDWYTKQTLLRRMPANASEASRKKVDIRYHEVGQQSYYYRICRQRELLPLIDRQTLSRAARSPPADTPATRRGYLIREFSGSGQTLQIDWDQTRVVPVRRE